MEAEHSLFKLEVNQDSLKGLLDSMMHQVHRNKADAELLAKQLAYKLDSHSACLALQGACTDIQIPDMDVLKAYQKQHSLQRYNTYSRNEVAEIKTLFQKRFNELYFLASQFDAADSDLTSKIAQLEKEVNSKMDAQLIKEKLAQQKNQLTEQLEEESKQSHRRILQNEERMEQELVRFKELIQETEKKTFWRMQDQQMLIEKRASRDYVQQVVAQLEQRVLEKVESRSSLAQVGKAVQQLLNDQVLGKLRHTEDYVQDKCASNKRLVKELKDAAEKMFVSKDAYSLDKQGLNERINDTNSKLKAMNKVNDLELEIKRLQSQLKQTGNTLLEHVQLESTRYSELQQTNINLASAQGGQGGTGGIQIDMHKLCRLEQEIKRADQQSQDNKAALKQLNDLIKSQGFRTGRLGTGSAADGYENTPVDSQEVETMVTNLVSEEMNRVRREAGKKKIENETQNVNNSDELQTTVKRMQRQIQELLRRTESISELEKRTNQLLKDLDVGWLIKTIKSKVDSNDTEVRFRQEEVKIQMIADSINLLRKEIDSLFSFIKKQGVQQQQNQNPPIGSFNQTTSNPNNSFIQTKRLYPQVSHDKSQSTQLHKKYRQDRVNATFQEDHPPTEGCFFQHGPQPKKKSYRPQSAKVTHIQSKTSRK